MMDLKLYSCTLFVLLVFVPVCIFGQGFRGNPWQASKEQIIKREGKPDADDGDEIMYKSKQVSGYTNVMTYFKFNPKGKFVYGHYVFITPGKEALKQVGRALTKKYGSSEVRKSGSKTRLYHWLTTDSHILIEQDDLSFLLNYYSKPYWNQILAERNKLIQEGL